MNLNDWEEEITPCDTCRNTRDIDLMLLLILKKSNEPERAGTETARLCQPHCLIGLMFLDGKIRKFSIMPSLVFPFMTLVRICREMGGLVAETLSTAITHFEGELPVHISTWA
jgi:hypothetical protein